MRQELPLRGQMMDINAKPQRLPTIKIEFNMLTKCDGQHAGILDSVMLDLNVLASSVAFTSVSGHKNPPIRKNPSQA